MKLTKIQKDSILICDELSEGSSLENYVVPKIKAEIPTNFSVKVRDYHEFDLIRDYFEICLGLEYEFEEVGCDGKYEAVFYIGPKPEKLINKIKQTYED